MADVCKGWPASTELLETAVISGITVYLAYVLHDNIKNQDFSLSHEFYHYELPLGEMARKLHFFSTRADIRSLK